MANSIIYQVSAEDLRQFGLDIIAEVRKADEADRKRGAEQELQPIPFVADFLKSGPADGPQHDYPGQHPGGPCRETGLV